MKKLLFGLLMLIGLDSTAQGIYIPVFVGKSIVNTSYTINAGVGIQTRQNVVIEVASLVHLSFNSYERKNAYIPHIAVGYSIESCKLSFLPMVGYSYHITDMDNKANNSSQWYFSGALGWRVSEEAKLCVEYTKSERYEIIGIGVRIFLSPQQKSCNP